MRFVYFLLLFVAMSAFAQHGDSLRMDSRLSTGRSMFGDPLLPQAAGSGNGHADTAKGVLIIERQRSQISPALETPAFDAINIGPGTAKVRGE